MKINKIKINSYGKIKNKEINLENHLNIIYGKNESGKSTILNFIINILYGISKSKNGKEIQLTSLEWRILNMLLNCLKVKIHLKK